MHLKTEEDIILLVKKDKWMMDILKAARTLYLPDWWICAGFVRSKIWDTLHGFQERTMMADIDVIYFDDQFTEKLEEKKWEKKLRSIVPDIPWSVKNQARMHIINYLPPYTCSVDAISKFPETATALGLQLDREDNVILTAPCGINDVINLVLKPTPFFKDNKQLAKIYKERIRKKNWKSIWNNLIIHPFDID
ncbi:nucleotidyltransferase family protein [Bacillus chungangensis]|uniref:nucleotidyltransferase family protein n=1 Tax=Bacillus chungangensis TaxID=587633 RepID=UPI0027D820E3|nr:nucleotidyltransferase family protein [Bacillus chungangensis]